MMATEERNRAEEQAKAQFDSIQDMLHRKAQAVEKKNYNLEEEIQEEIYNDPLSVEVTKQYEILLCWGGPACRISGALDEYNMPETAKLQYQDWGTYWTDYTGNEETLLEYARNFYYGESN